MKVGGVTNPTGMHYSSPTKEQKVKLGGKLGGGGCVLEATEKTPLLNQISAPKVLHGVPTPNQW